MSILGDRSSRDDENRDCDERENGGVLYSVEWSSEEKKDLYEVEMEEPLYKRSLVERAVAYMKR